MNWFSFNLCSLNSNVSISNGCEGKIAALLKAFGFERWLVGLANVLQCGWVSLTDPKGRSGPAKTNFFLQYVSIKVNIFSVLFFNFQIMLSMYRCLFSLAHNVLQLQEVGDFEALNCLPALHLIRSIKLHLTTEPPISCRCC